MPQQQFEDFLEAVSRCFVERDFLRWRSRIIYPFTMITSVGPVVITNDADLRDNFALYLQACDAMRLDEIVRTSISLEECQDQTWIGTYETNLLSHGVRATAPYTSSALMILDDSVFRMKSILNARGHHDWTGKQPKSFDS